MDSGRSGYRPASFGGGSGKSEFEIGGKTMDENKRGSFGSTIGFLLSAIGSAVGLGNIWGFPYKMGRCGGFTFLIVYLALAAFVGFAIMLSELAISDPGAFTQLIEIAKKA